MKAIITNHLIKPGVEGSTITEDMIDGLEVIGGKIVSVQYHLIGYPQVVCATDRFTIDKLEQK